MSFRPSGEFHSQTDVHVVGVPTVSNFQHSESSLSVSLIDDGARLEIQPIRLGENASELDCSVEVAETASGQIRGAESGVVTVIWASSSPVLLLLWESEPLVAYDFVEHSGYVERVEGGGIPRQILSLFTPAA